ncbi:MAG: hypothetical protein PHZ19_10675 [Candidatus Thermoplasmatota archaeon]|nr:hypothetical protein [Candidatus Thermoplasmatota archaeon]
MLRAAYAKLSQEERRRVRMAASRLMDKLNFDLSEALEVLAAVGRKMVEEEWTPQ